MNVILIINDTFRRDHLAAYGVPAPWKRPGHEGEPFIETPNLDRLAAESAMFDRFYISSYPTVPCRTDIITGKYSFPFRGWQPLEPTDVVLSEIVARTGRTPVFIFDTPMLGVDSYNFMRGFQSWEFVRGQHADRWNVDRIPVTLPAAPHRLKSIPATELYLRNTAHRKSDADWMSAKTIRTAMDWLERNKDRDDFVMWVDMWDPHEPFDAPEADLARYADPTYHGDAVIYPAYGRAQFMSDAQRNHVRASYAAQGRLVDRWLGRLTDTLRTTGLDRNTLLLFTTDHGHLFGEHDLQGKPTGPLGKLYEVTTRVPLLIRHPQGVGAGKRIGALAQHPDLLPTILEFLGVPAPADLHGKSLWPVITGKASEVREFAVSGRFTPTTALNTKDPLMTFRTTTASAFDGTAGVATKGGAFTVTTRRWTYLCPARGDGTPELYDLDADPRQQRNLVPTERAIAADLHAKLIAFLTGIGMAPDRIELYRNQLERPVRSALFPQATPVWMGRDESGQTIAFVDEKEFRRVLGRSLVARDPERLTLEDLRTQEPKALVMAGEQYYWAEELV